MDAPALTTDSDLLNKQAAENKTLKQELKTREPDLHILLDKGHKFLQDATPSEETRALQDTLANMGDMWGHLKDSVSGILSDS